MHAAGMHIRQQDLAIRKEAHGGSTDGKQQGVVERTHFWSSTNRPLEWCRS